MAKQSEHEQWLSSRFPGGVPAVPDWSDVRMAYEAGRINGEFAASADRQEILEALKRARKFVEQDAQMMADISRHAPLPADEQVVHDSTEYESEALLPVIDALLVTGA